MRLVGPGIGPGADLRPRFKIPYRDNVDDFLFIQYVLFSLFNNRIPFVSTVKSVVFVKYSTYGIVDLRFLSFAPY